MDEQALERAKKRIAEAREGRNEEGRFEAALRRSREEVEALGAAALALETALPDRIGEAVQEGLRREVLPVARNLGEIKGLLNNAIGRLERLEQELIAERNARLDDLTLLVELISSGWQGSIGDSNTSSAATSPRSCRSATTSPPRRSTTLQADVPRGSKGMLYGHLVEATCGSTARGRRQSLVARGRARPTREGSPRM